MFTITVFLKSLNAPPITLVYTERKTFDIGRALALAATEEPLIISDDFEQDLIALRENIAAFKFESMDETRKLMIEHNLYQHVTKAMMDARVGSDPRITRTRGATLMDPNSLPAYNGR